MHGPSGLRKPENVDSGFEFRLLHQYMMLGKLRDLPDSCFFTCETAITADIHSIKIYRARY